MLVIFDCDGVLVDSEELAFRAHRTALRRFGYSTPPAAELARRYAGLCQPEFLKCLHRDFGWSLDEEYEAICQSVLEDEMRENLRPIPEIQETIHSVLEAGLRICVASNSSLRRVEHSLKCTKLWAFFENYSYSAEAVGRGKPDPALFEHAAFEMGASVTECIVVEDSIQGVLAGKAAGMHVIGFTGAEHCSPYNGEQLRGSGADEIVSRAGQLSEAIFRHGDKIGSAVC